MRDIAQLGVLGFAVLTVLGVLAPATAAAAGTTALQPRIACPAASPCCGPVTGARPAAVPCCPVPTVGPCCDPTTGSGCCPTSPCPSALTISVSPDPAGEGQRATISGTLTGGTVAAQTVTLWERLAGQSAFSDVASTQTSAAGAFSFARVVNMNAQWYAKAGSVLSSTVSQSVLAAIALHPSRLRPKVGAKVTLSGTIAPSHAGERVALQRLRRGRWVTVARPRLNRRSRFAVAQRLRGRSVARYRVILAADARNARSVSGTVSIAHR